MNKLLCYLGWYSYKQTDCVWTGYNHIYFYKCKSCKKTTNRNPLMEVLG